MHKYKTVLSYFLNCKKNTENINSRVSKTSNNKTMLLWKCAIWCNKKSRFNKKQDANGKLSNLGLKKPLCKIPFFGDILFWMQLY